MISLETHLFLKRYISMQQETAAEKEKYLTKIGSVK